MLRPPKTLLRSEDGVKGVHQVNDLKAELVVLLGHENDKNGVLSPVAHSRIDTLVAYLSTEGRVDTASILTTGGFGEFNPSNTPHGKILMKHLHDRNIPHSELIGYINSAGTIQDGIGVLRVVKDNYTNKTLDIITVITSKFHENRARYIFERLFPDIDLQFISDEDVGTDKRRKHEKRAMANIS